jgi:hypothetical protein
LLRQEHASRAIFCEDVEKQYPELWRSVTHLPGFSSLWDEFKSHGEPTTA